jgi:1,4-alpha-glucan branching enzyme
MMRPYLSTGSTPTLEVLNHPALQQRPPANSESRGSRGSAICRATERSRQPGHVIFRFHDEGAERVRLVADFAGWETQPIDLRQQDNGDWQLTVELPPGRYSYRFLVNDQWKDDPESKDYEFNSYGTLNAVVVVS